MFIGFIRFWSLLLQLTLFELLLFRKDKNKGAEMSIKTRQKPTEAEGVVNPGRQLLKASEIAKITGLSKVTINNYINGYYIKNKQLRVNEVGFPKPVKVIGRTRLFSRDEIYEYFNLKQPA